MLIKNALVLNHQFKIVKADVKLNEDRIEDIGEFDGQADSLDASGMYLLPGLIDIHMHGCAGSDFCDADENSLHKIAEYQAVNGITSFLPASMTISENELENVFGSLKAYMTNQNSDTHICAHIYGAYMEGPFFSKEKKGAQSEEHIKKPDIAMFNRLNTASGGNIRVVALAPELAGSFEFIEAVKGSTKISIAHTTANYDTAKKAINAGAAHITHLFNAMPPYKTREPGVIGAAFDSDATVELICDGIHIHPSVIRSTYKTVGAERVVLVSDSMRACGMADGWYSLGGQNVNVVNGTARLSDGTIAGSAKNLYQCVKTALSFGIALPDAVRSASINPAKVAGIDHLTGSIEKGKYADLILTDKDFNIKKVFVRGKEIEAAAK